MNMNCVTSSDFHLRPASPDGHDIFRRTFDNSDVSGGNSVNYSQNPKKKRTKMVRIENSCGVSKPKCGKKPDPSAPKITKPCSECGKKFWSWKALFGHMRCHPERQWRGINPPPNLRRDNGGDGRMTEEDHHIAACLLMLANGPARIITTDDVVAATTPPTITGGGVTEPETGFLDTGIRIVESYGSVHASMNCGKFECSSCKKVFGSHQALGGHRASHKNVKGCFANTRNEGGEVEQMEEVVEVGHGVVMGPTDHTMVKGNMGINNNDVMMVLGAHQCGLCLRVFSSGQALGGHKRCHWEKGEVVPAASGAVLSIVPYDDGGFDLNLPASSIGEDDGESPSSDLGVDLRLGL